MKQVITLILLAVFSLTATAAEYSDASMKYSVRLDTAQHYIDVQLNYHPNSQQKELVLKMPVWAPGYYMIMNYPKHLCDFSATDSAGKPLVWKKEGKSTWRITTRPSTDIIVKYRIFADQYDVASSRVDGQGAFIAPNGVFMYADGGINDAVSISFDIPNRWKNISTGLSPHKDNPHAFTSPNFDTLYDSPFLMGNHLVKSFQHEGHEYEFALESPEGFEESGFEDAFRKIVSTATNIIKDVPYEKYTLIHLGKGQGGLEHLNSQACYTDGTFRFDKREDWLNYLAFTAHEYFHLYNVKTIRPIELGPFDYEREVFTPLLWFSEGITCYYEAQILYRAGLATKEEMYQLISEYMQMDERYEGHHHQSLRQTSYDIWLNFLNRDANSRDVTINYYFRGPVVGLIMDIEIQRLSQGKRSLDDLMRLLYNRYHKEKGRGFTEEEFWASVDEVAGASMSHIRNLVDNPVDIDYESFFTPVGLTLDRETWNIKIKK